MEDQDYSGSSKSYDPNEYERSLKESAEKYVSHHPPKRDLSFAEFIEEVKRMRENVAPKK